VASTDIVVTSTQRVVSGGNLLVPSVEIFTTNDAGEVEMELYSGYYIAELTYEGRTHKFSLCVPVKTAATFNEVVQNNAVIAAIVQGPGGPRGPRGVPGPEGPAGDPSGVTIDDDNNMDIPGDLTVDGTLTVNSSEVTPAGLVIMSAADAAAQAAALGLGSAAFLQAGTGANQLLQLNGAGLLPALDARNLTSIPGLGSTHLGRAVADDDAVIEFSAFDPANYDAYVFSCANVVPITDSVNFYLQLSNDGGLSFIATNTYDWRGKVTGTTLAQASDSDIGLRLNNGIALGNDTGKGVSGTITLFAPHLTGFTVARWNTSVTTVDGIITDTRATGHYKDAAEPHNAVRFLMSSGNIASGIINMYGLRRAAL
jgi:hypothetical protein